LIWNKQWPIGFVGVVVSLEWLFLADGCLLHRTIVVLLRKDFSCGRTTPGPDPTPPFEFALANDRCAEGSEPIDSEIMALNKAIIGQTALELLGVIDSDHVAVHQLRLDPSSQPSFRHR
jgi:hypothetical protein